MNEMIEQIKKRPFLVSAMSFMGLSLASFLVAIWTWDYRVALTGAVFLVTAWLLGFGAIAEKRH